MLPTVLALVGSLNVQGSPILGNMFSTGLLSMAHSLGNAHRGSPVLASEGTSLLEA